MELVDVTISELARRSRSIVVHHSATSLTRGLAPGEDVVVRDVTGDFYAGIVLDVDFELDDTVYRISVGVRLPEENAMSRLGMVIPPQRGESGPEFVDMDRLLTLLGHVREQQSKTSPSTRGPRPSAARSFLRPVRTESDASEN